MAATAIIHEIKYYAPIAASKLYEQRHNFMRMLTLRGRAKTEQSGARPSKSMWHISKDDHASHTPTPARQRGSAHKAHKEQAKEPSMSGIPASFSAYFQK